MNEPKQLPIGKQVSFAFGTLCAILLIIGGLFYFSLRAIDRSNEVQQSRALNKLALIDDTAQDVGQLQADVLREILASDLGEIKKLDQTVHDIEKTNAEELARYRQLIDTQTERQLYNRVMQTRKAYWEQTQPVLVFSRADQDAGATKIVNSTQAPAYDEFLKAINEMADYVEADAKETSTATTHFISKIRIIGDILIGVTILIAIGTARFVVQVTHRLRADNTVLQNEIIERRRAEEMLRVLNSAMESEREKLRESEEKFRQLAENISDVFWMTSPDMQKVHYVSPAYERLWGRPTAGAIAFPQEWAEAIVPEDREQVSATFARLMAGEPSVSVEFRIARPDGEVRWVHSRGFPVRDAAGKVIRLTGIACDITERKRIEAQLIQSQRLETVGKLAGGVAHEFNSILTAIIGQSELLLGDLPAESSMARNATEISKAANRAASLTRQLLAYGRKQLLQPESLDLNRVIAGMEGMFHHLMSGEVDMQIMPAPGLKAIRADAGQIEQVIINMIINARDAMPNGGKLTLETANVSFDQESVGRYPELKAGDYVMLAITDTGAGMTEEVRARVFEPFFTTKDVGQGTGLGLSTCYGIIKQSGGYITVYSELGRGATFKIYLPQAEAATNVPAPILATPAMPRGTETILLVEDDPALREMASSLLERLGYTVLAAANGLEALNLKHQRGAGHVDLLFTDVVMPHMSGRELADRVRSLYPRTRILFTSAYTENAIVHQGVLNKGVALLQKPFTPSALARKVRDILDQPDAGPATGRIPSQRLMSNV